MIYCPNNVERGCELPPVWEPPESAGEFFAVCPTCRIPIVIEGPNVRAMTGPEFAGLPYGMRELFDFLRVPN